MSTAPCGALHQLQRQTPGLSRRKMGDDLADKFARVDASYSFLARHRAVLTVRNVLRMAASLGGPVSREDLARMARMAPALLRIEPNSGREMQHKDDVYRAAPATDEEREVVAFPLVPQASQRASERRKKLFAEAVSAASSGGKAAGSSGGKAGISQDTKGQEKPRLNAAEADSVGDVSAQDAVPASDSGQDQAASTDAPVIDMLQRLDIYRGQIVHVERTPARPPQFRGLNEIPELDERVVQALVAGGVQQLYSHQYEAIQAILAGKNVVLSTSTASGKSLAYNVPMANMLLADPSSTFMYMFPTKALAQDQLKALRTFLGASKLPMSLCSTFDGDTAMKARSMIIRETNVFLTNPDMLHLSILPQHTRWKRVLANLKFVVVDEAHMYRGVFGSHVACVFRRLFRICALHGSNPQIVCCSATIHNPREHFGLLFPALPQDDESESHSFPGNDDGGKGNSGQNPPAPANFYFFRARHLQVITSDGAPRGEKLFCLWNPRVETPATPGETLSVDVFSKPPGTSKGKKRKRPKCEDNEAEQKGIIKDDEPVSMTTSAIFQSARIFSRLMEAEIHTLLFCRGRKLSELVLMNVHSILRDGSADPSSKAPASSSSSHRQRLLKRISSYRGGYTIDDRRAIEHRLFSGDLLGVIATNALELGIDIGALDCTVHLGLPGSIASLWQQAGRAGRQRSCKLSTAIVVCFDAPLDQHFARHAQELFRLPPEAVALNPNNELVLSQHLVCAARESPLYSPQSGMDYIDSFVFGSIFEVGEATNNSEYHSKPDMRATIDSLVKQQKLMRWPERKGASYRAHACAPKESNTVSLRSIHEISYTVVTDDGVGAVLDEIPGERVFFQVYPTAVYLHQAQEYLITRIDSDQKLVFARRCEEPLTYFTRCRDFTDLQVVQMQWQRQVGAPDSSKPTLVIGVGMVSAITRVFGSTLHEKKTLKMIHKNEFSLPPMQKFGRAVWLELPREVRVQVEELGRNWIGSLHGVGHLCAAVVRLFVLCDAADVGTEHPNPFEARVKPNRVTLYEEREGGSGLVDEIVKVLPQMIDKVWTIASECACPDGCPACIQSAACSEYNHVLDKRGALIVLEFLHNSMANYASVISP